MTIEDLLHDEIDEAEDLSEEAARVVDAVKARAAEIAKKVFDAGGDAADLMQALALVAENELADITTKAVRSGLKAGDKRRKLLGG